MIARLLCLLPTLAAAAAAQQTVLDAVFPADAPTQVGDEKWQTCRVVDAISGKPIVGAELLLIEERRTPLAGETWSKRVGTSDADGFVRVRSDDIEGGFNMLLLRAKGYGPSAVGAIVPSLVWALAPAIDVPVELRDWQGQPVPNTRIGLCLGGGNTPDVAEATTDATGAAFLRGVDPHNPTADIYPSGPEWALTDYGRAEWVPGEHPVRIDIARGRRIPGKVLGADGKPKAGVFVGAPQVARGPWTKTGDDGSFVLEGAVADPDLLVMVGRQLVIFERPDGEPPFTLQLPELPAPKEDEAEEDDAKTAPDARGQRRRKDPEPIPVDRAPLPEDGKVAVELRVQDPTGKPIEQLEVQVRGPMPRYRISAEDVRDGASALDRLPGRYLVTTDDPAFEAEIGSFEVAAGKPAKFTLTAQPLATLQVQVDKTAELGSISLRTATGSREITAAFDADGKATVSVPNREPFCFVVGNETGVTMVRTTLAEAKAKQPFQLRQVLPTKVSGKVVGPDGKTVPADVVLLNRFECLRAEGGFDPRKLEAPTAAADGKFALTTPHEGLVLLVAVPRDESLRPAIMPVTLPRRGAAVSADLGNIAVSKTAQLTVLAADGRPVNEGMVALMRKGLHDVRQQAPAFALDAKGGLLAPPLQAGDAVVFPPAGWELETPEDDAEPVIDLPCRTVLSGDGPWTLTVPAGELMISLRDSKGAPLTGRVFLGDRCLLVRGKLRVRQVPLGKHDLFGVAVDHKAARATIEVGAKPAEITLDLVHH